MSAGLFSFRPIPLQHMPHNAPVYRHLQQRMNVKVELIKDEEKKYLQNYYDVEFPLVQVPYGDIIQSIEERGSINSYRCEVMKQVEKIAVRDYELVAKFVWEIARNRPFNDNDARSPQEKLETCLHYFKHIMLKYREANGIRLNSTVDKLDDTVSETETSTTTEMVMTTTTTTSSSLPPHIIAIKNRIEMNLQRVNDLENEIAQDRAQVAEWVAEQRKHYEREMRRAQAKLDELAIL